MRDCVADTHAVIWYLSGNKRLSRKVRAIFQKAVAGYGHVVIPSIVVVETIFLAQRERLDEEVVKTFGVDGGEMRVLSLLASWFAGGARGKLPQARVGTMTSDKITSNKKNVRPDCFNRRR